MGNWRLEHRWSWVNIAPPIVSKVVVVETWTQHVGIRVIQSLDVGIITIGVETIVTPNIVVVRKGILIGSATKLGSKLGGV
jgi:hypothetical protein